MDHLLACSVVLCQYNIINSLLTEFYIKTKKDVVNDEPLANFNGSPKSFNRIKNKPKHSKYMINFVREIISKIIV